MDTEALVLDPFATVGDQSPAACRKSLSVGVDVVLEPDGVATGLHVTRRSLVTDDVAARLLADAHRVGRCWLSRTGAASDPSCHWQPLGRH